MPRRWRRPMLNMREYSEAEKQMIFETVDSKGFKLIMEAINDAILSLRLPKNVDRKRNFRDIAIQTLGKSYAVRKMEKVMKQIYDIKPIKKKEPHSWA